MSDPKLSKLPLALLAALSLCGAGCSDDDNGSDIVPTSLPECPQHDYHVCDTRGIRCQQRLLALAACVYGAEEVPEVPVQVVTEAEFREALEADLENVQAMRTEEEIAAREVLESALIDLRLGTAGALSDEGRIDDYVENLGGVYIDAETGVVLIDHGSPSDDVDANSLLVHELVHALQDADYDLETWVEPYRSLTDALLAARSVTEGQATYYQFRVGVAMLGRTVETVDFEQTLLNLVADLDDVARADPSPYTRSASTFPYGYGGLAALQDWLVFGQGYEAALIDATPPSTLEVIRRGTRPEDPETEALELVAPLETGDYALLDEDVLGGWLLSVLLSKHGVSTSTAESLAATWSGDHLWLYRDSADSRGWLWQLQLSSESAAAEVMGALNGELPEAVHIEHGGSRLFIASGNDGAPQELLDAGQAFLTAE